MHQDPLTLLFFLQLITSPMLLLLLVIAQANSQSNQLSLLNAFAPLSSLHLSWLYILHLHLYILLPHLASSSTHLVLHHNLLFALFYCNFSIRTNLFDCIFFQINRGITLQHLFNFTYCHFARIFNNPAFSRNLHFCICLYCHCCIFPTTLCRTLTLHLCTCTRTSFTTRTLLCYGYLCNAKYKHHKYHQHDQSF